MDPGAHDDPQGLLRVKAEPMSPRAEQQQHLQQQQQQLLARPHSANSLPGGQAQQHPHLSPGHLSSGNWDQTRCFFFATYFANKTDKKSQTRNAPSRSHKSSSFDLPLIQLSTPLRYGSPAPSTAAAWTSTAAPSSSSATSSAARFY